MNRIPYWWGLDRAVVALVVGAALIMGSLVWFARVVLPKIDLTDGEAILLIMILLTNRSCNCKCSK